MHVYTPRIQMIVLKWVCQRNTLLFLSFSLLLFLSLAQWKLWCQKENFSHLFFFFVSSLSPFSFPLLLRLTSSEESIQIKREREREKRETIPVLALMVFRKFVSLERKSIWHACFGPTHRQMDLSLRYFDEKIIGIFIGMPVRLLLYQWNSNKKEKETN